MGQTIWITGAACALALAACGRAPTPAANAVISQPPAENSVTAVTAATDQPTGTAVPLPAGAPWDVSADNMGYISARRLLIQHGFTPVPVQHDPEDVQLGSGSALGKAFPEAVFCSGTGSGRCQFLFQSQANGSYLIVQTAGEDDDNAPPGSGFGVTALFAGTVKTHSGAAPGQDDVLAGDTNILEAFTPWKPNDKVVDDLNQDGDRLSAAIGTADSPYVAFDGTGFLTRLKAAGYTPHGFSRAIGDDERIDLTKGGGDTIRVYVTVSADFNAGSPTIFKVEANGKTYTDDTLKAWLSAEAAQ